jgi:hypothetical protein
MEVSGGHTHFYMGYTTLDNGHSHYLWGYTYMSMSDSNPEAKKQFTVEEAREIGRQLEVDFSKFDAEQFRTGLNVELEHGRIESRTNVSNDDPIVTGKIALAHLNEFPDYYVRLARMEEEAEEYYKNT